MKIVSGMVLMLLLTGMLVFEVQELKAESIDVSDEGRGVWVYASDLHSPDEIHETFSLFSKIGLNSVFLLVKDSHCYLYYNSSFELWRARRGLGTICVACPTNNLHGKR